MARESTKASENGNAAMSDRDADLPLAIEKSDATTPKRSRRRLTRWLLLPVLLIPIYWAGGFVGLYFQPPGLKMLFSGLDIEPGGGTADPIAVSPIAAAQADVPADTWPAIDQVVGLGTLLPRGDVMTVNTPSGAGDATIARLAVAEGERVETGQILAVLDSEPRLKAAVDAARATLMVRDATLVQTRASVKASIDEASAALASAEARALNAERQYTRAETLIGRGAISESVLDDRLAERDQARREVEEARATLLRYDYGNIESQPDVRVAAGNVVAAQAELAYAEHELDMARVVAPASGTVLDIHVELGERPDDAGVMDIGDIDRMTVEVEVYETEIGAVSIGNQVEVTSEALEASLFGRVQRIGLAVGRQTLVDDDPAALTDARVIEVTVTLDEASSRQASRFTGMQVVAHIDVAGDRGQEAQAKR